MNPHLGGGRPVSPGFGRAAATYCRVARAKRSGEGGEGGGEGGGEASDLWALATRPVTAEVEEEEDVWGGVGGEGGARYLGDVEGDVGALRLVLEENDRAARTVFDLRMWCVASVLLCVANVLLIMCC